MIKWLVKKILRSTIVKNELTKLIIEIIEDIKTVNKIDLKQVADCIISEMNHAKNI